MEIKMGSCYCNHIVRVEEDILKGLWMRGLFWGPEFAGFSLGYLLHVGIADMKKVPQTQSSASWVYNKTKSS